MFSYPSPEDYEALQDSGLFLADWYRTEYAASLPGNVDPLMDFCARGWEAAHAPNPYFDTATYLQSNPEVAREKLNPLLHYLRQGDQEGRRPCALFDPAWYRATYNLDTVENTLAHFLRHRATGRVSPIPGFDPVRYLRTHPDVFNSQADPFLHARATHDFTVPTEADIIALSGLFDATHYLLANPDVREHRSNPLIHFCGYGWRENRNPNLYFDTSFYAARLETPANPLVHYYLIGEPAGWLPCPHFNPAWYAQFYDIPPARSALRHYLEHRRTQAYSPNPDFDVAAHVHAFKQEMGPNRDPFVDFLKRKNVLF